jgi:DNA invertase Pin-like site-specific DNA recombinase
MEKYMKNIGYLRVSTDKQDLDNQKLAILEYARKRDMKVHKFIKMKISSKRSVKDRKIDDVVDELHEGDTLLIYELSRIGRSLGQIINIVNNLVEKKVRFVSIKEDININGTHSIQSKVTVGLFGIFAEVERDLISQRTKQGLISARLKGKLIGRPKGSIGKSKLDGKEEQIRELLDKDISKTSIAKIFDVSRSCLYNFIETRKLLS